MPWHEVSTMSLREEFVMVARQEGANMALLCRRFGIARRTGYKWLARFASEGRGGLSDRSRRPHRSPTQTPAALEEAVIALRRRHPTWGGRKLARRLQALGHDAVPAPSTITAMLHRHHLLTPTESAKHQAFVRFEHATPNALWQMDFKGWFQLPRGRCHPLTVLDDHSRFNLLLRACADQQGTTVQAALTAVFRRYGLPVRMTMDNGAPWGSDAAHVLTPLTLWLMRLGIAVSHSRPYHPQTQGKDERFHRTLECELLQYRVFRDLTHVQWHFDRFRELYNLERPHEALGLEVPGRRYQPSVRAFPEPLPPIEYAPGDVVRKVDHGTVSYRGHVLRVPKALHGYPVAIRATCGDGTLAIYFCQSQVAAIDLRHLKI